MSSVKLECPPLAKSEHPFNYSMILSARRTPAELVVAERPFMDLTNGFPRLFVTGRQT